MRVFISHSAREKAFADGVRMELSSRGFAVWNPDRELLPGDNWLLETGRALERADAVVFVLSEDSSESFMAKGEIQYVIAHAKFEDRVFPIRVGSDPQKVPWVFRDMVIDAPSADAASAAREIARRLRPAGKAGPRAVSKRRSSSPVVRKIGKVAKTTSTTPRRRSSRVTRSS